MGELPNTYVFTKQLAEHVLWEEKGKLPIIIMRPSIGIAKLRKKNKNNGEKIEKGPVVAQGHVGVTVKATGCSFDSHSRKKYLFKFIFSFLRSGVETKRGVEFCQSTPSEFGNAFSIRRKVGNEMA